MNTWKMLSALIIFIFISGCIQDGQAPNTSSSPSTPIPPVPTTSPVPIATPVRYHVGETASDGVVNITLNGLRYATLINENDVARAQPGNEYVILDITLEVIKSGEKRYYPQGGPFKVKDSRGYIYTNHKYEYQALKRPLQSNQNLTYGDKIRGELSFEIPENNNELSFQFQFDSDNYATFTLREI